jgi:hypothetical protein
MTRDHLSGWIRALGLPILLALILVGVGLSLLLSNAPPVVVSWETASEVGAAGFNVYRSPVWESREAVRVNPALIPSTGDETVGATYRFEDRDRALIPGRRYRYQIEEVEWDGSATLYPEAVVVRAGLPALWTKIEGVVLIVLALILTLRPYANRLPGAGKLTLRHRSRPGEDG